MKLMKKRIIGVIAAAAMLPSLAACGGGGDATTPSAAPKPTGTAPVIGSGALTYDPNLPVNDGQPITLSFWYPASKSKPQYADAIADYQQLHPNVKIEVNDTLGWNDYWAKLPVAVASGSGPDLMHFHLNWYADFIPTLAEPFPSDFADGVKKEFPGAEAMSYEDSLYTVPTGNMTGAMFYNKNLWKDAGLTDADIPKTWDELHAVAEKLTKRNGNDIEVSGFDLPDGWLMLGLNYQKGHFLYKEDGKHTQLDNPGALEAAKMLQRFTDDKISRASSGGPEERFGNQKSAMLYGWTWMGSWLTSNVKDTFEWGVFPTPTFGAETKVVDRNNPDVSAIVNAKADDKNKAVALDFLKFYLANDKYLLALCVANGEIPSKASLVSNEAITGDPVLSVVSTYIDKTIWPGVTPSVLDTALSQALTDELLAQNKDAQAALAKFDELNAVDADQIEVPTVERRSPLAGDLK